MVQDITDRKAAATHVAVIATDTDGLITTWNTGAERMLGYTAAEMVGKQTPAVLHLEAEVAALGRTLSEEYGERIEGFEVFVARARRGGYGEHEWTYVRKDGSHLAVSLAMTAVWDKTGRITGFLGMVLDITERKHAEEAQSEQRFRSLSDAALEGIMIHQQGMILDANLAFARLFGYELPEEIIGKNGIELLLTPESREHIWLRIQQQQNGPMEVTGIRKDGSTFVAETDSRPLKYMGTDARLVSCRDITERKQAVEALRASEDKYRQLVENSHDIIYSLGADGVFRFVSPAWTRILGHPVAEVEGHSFTEFVHPDDLPACLAFIQKVVETGERQEGVEYRVRQADGTWRWHTSSASPIRDASGAVSYSDAIARDITERKQAQQALEATLLFLSQNEKIARIGGFKTNPRTDSLLWTEGIYRLIEAPLDYKPELTEGLNFYAPEYRPLIRDAVTRTLDAGTPFLVEAELITTSGRRLWVEVRGLARVEAGGEPAVVGTLQDITERKRAEEENEKLQAQLVQAQKMESVGQLAGGVAHDFNNMLGVILGHTEMALERIGPDEPLYEDLKEIQRAAERSANLTRQLLAFARKQTIAPKVLDLNETVAGMVKMLRRLIGEDIDLVWLPGADLGAVFMDPSQVDQILANLCVNARDAIAGTGKITIETANAVIDEDYCAQHAGFVPGDYVLLAVSDDGCGMDAEMLSRLFEPFFTTKEMGKGTGLGLATVYGAVKQNDGFINVYSELGCGTTVNIYLLRHRVKTAPETAKHQPPAEAQGSETILLVEDESAILAMTKTMLKRMGYTVFAAKTPGEAIRLAREHAGLIDLVMTDVVMPEMNGRDLARNLMSIHPNIKRLFVSGYTADVIAHHGVLDEGVYFLQKPFSMKDLGAKIREVLVNR